MQNLLNKQFDPLPWAQVAGLGRTPLVMIRHGRTAHNLERRFVGSSDVPLDEVGLRQARSLADRLRDLPRSGLFSSTLSRARVTAQALGEPVQLAGLTELNQGALEGMHGKDAFARYPEFFATWRHDPTHARVPGGETLFECQARSLKAVRELSEGIQPGPPIVVVAHQMVLASLILHALELPLRFIHMVKQGNTAVNLLSIDPAGELRVHRLNDCAHLPEEERPRSGR